MTELFTLAAVAMAFGGVFMVAALLLALVDVVFKAGLSGLVRSLAGVGGAVWGGVGFITIIICAV